MKLICFDLDGTLIDSRRDIVKAANKALNSLGQKEVSIEDGLQYIGKGARYLMEMLMSEKSNKSLDEITNIFVNFYHDDPVTDTTVYPGVKKFLEKNCLDFELVVISNKDQNLSSLILKELGLLSYFKKIVGANTYPVIKPDPFALNEMMHLFGAEIHQTIMVGDTNVDVQFGRNAKVKTCRFINDFGALKNEAVLQADFDFSNYEELENFIRA